MISAEMVQPTLSFLTWFCYIVLAIYIARILKFIFYGQRSGDSHRLRESMAMAYTAVAAWFIILSTQSIYPFVTNVIEAVGLIHALSAKLKVYLALCAGFVCAAFICNFSRSLWMLKSLDHAIFDPVPDWEQLSSSVPKRWSEFLTRSLAALLFIRVEFELKELAASSPGDDIALVASGTEPRNYLNHAGKFGLLLYLALVIWWIVGLFIAKGKMPKSLLVFYVMGLINSGFIYVYGGEVVSADQAMMLLLSVAVVACAALYMLGTVSLDVLGTIFSVLRALWETLRSASVRLWRRFFPQFKT